MPKPADKKLEGNIPDPEDTQDIEWGHKSDRIEVGNVLAEMERALDDIAADNPKLGKKSKGNLTELEDLKSILEISLGINSSLFIDDILNTVMEKAVELLSAERGFIMLLDNNEKLQFKISHNIRKEDTSLEKFKISNTIANQVARTGKPVYASDALRDERYSEQQSVVELNLRSIMCVPLKINNRVIGVIYLDNSSQAKIFLKSDLYLFELFAQQAAIAIHNAQLYGRLSRLKKYYEDIITQSPVGIIVIDADYNLVTINAASLEIFQINRGDITLDDTSDARSCFNDLVPQTEFIRWQKMIEAAMSGNGDYREDRYFHNTGFEEKVLSVRISRTSSLPDNKVGAILVIEDNTEKVVLEKYVILSEKLVAKGEMAASIGHELNNYLTIISNNAELMQLNISRNEMEKASVNAERVIENITKMKRFTDGLMDFSKLETEMVSYDIRHLIEDLLFSIKAQKRFKGVLIDVACDDGLPEINMDVGQIQQVLLNLFNNACDAMIGQQNPEIRLDCTFDDEEEMMIIMVADNGHGMTELTREKIFEPHFTTKKDGHGLGLSNSRKIIRNHGGDIQVESEEGDGTTFIIKLPRSKK